jgi:glutamate-1-semialdehyde 2,1-aminomutase
MTDRYSKSRSLLKRAEQSLAGGVSSNVRRGDKPLPLYFDSGVGSRLFDVDGNEYIDYVLGRGPLILGHTHTEVIEATCRQLWRGQVYAAQHEAEIELAEKIVRIVPSAERVRFGISGSEAVHGALRLARAFTGRELVIKFEGHYHGWLDNILYSLSPSVDAVPDGLPESAGQFTARDSRVVVLPWNDSAAVESYLKIHGKDVAAIITEPIMGNTGVIEPRPGYLEFLREITKKFGIVLIFDEVITGFRVSLAGAQGKYGVRPDLSIFGKAVANGLPMSVIAGREDLFALIASGKVGHGGTYNSLPPAIAAGAATLGVLERDNGDIYRKIQQTGSALMEGIRASAAKVGVPIVVQGDPAVFFVGFPIDVGKATDMVDYKTSLAMDNELYAKFVSAMTQRGIRIIPRGNWFLSAAHSDADVAQTLGAVEESLSEVVVPHYASAGSALR